MLSNWQALNNLGVYQLEAKAYAEAKATLERVLSEKPAHRLALNNLALIYESTDYAGFDVEKALEIYSFLIERYPDDYVAAYNGARIFHFKKEYPRAEALYLRVLTLNPGHDLAASYLSLLYRQTGARAQAIEYLNKAWKLNPRNSLAAKFLEGI